MMTLIKAIQERDPAQPTVLEVVLAYNGFHAIAFHRVNHVIWNLGLKAIARTLSGFCRFLTGIEIHPEANIGQQVFIDHGTGVVIGQTSIIEDDVTIYHGVTLGGVGRQGAVDKKRHPTIKRGAIIGAGAQVLGNITVGEGAKVGANSVVTNDVPAHATALGIPARIVGGDERARGYGLPSRHEMEEITTTLDCVMMEMDAIKAKLGVESKECDKVKGKKKIPAKANPASKKKSA